MSDPVRVPRAVYLAIGDSNAQRFDGLVVETSDGPAVVKARWLPGMRTDALFANGRVGEFVARALREQRFLMKGGDEADNVFPVLLEQISATSYERVAPQPRDPQNAVIIFVSGGTNSIDVAWKLYPHYDVDLGERMPELRGAPPYVATHGFIAEADVRALIEAQLAPLFSAISALRSAGFHQLFVHDVQPTSWQQQEGWVNATLRFKVVVLLNEVLRDACDRLGATFVSTWHFVFEDGGRARAYDRDGEHLLPQAGARSMEIIQAALASDPLMPGES
ncbi:MAG: hypothetical protein KGN02_13245 [bacterium]|nr:hypothetical protein [bacterium]